jgi:hypothetical protein
MIPLEILQWLRGLSATERLGLARWLVEGDISFPEADPDVVQGIQRIEDIVAGWTKGLTEQQFRAALG